MKISYVVGPLVGIVAAAGIAVTTTTYFKAQQKTQADEAFSALVDRMSVDQHLSAALRKIHEGNVEAAAEHLDLLLCGHVLLTDSELKSADTQTRIFTKQAFQQIARLRPKTGERSASGSMWRGGPDQAAAEKILNVALACAPSGHAR